MGFKSCQELWSGRSGSFSDDLNREWKRQWRVVTDDVRMGPLAVIACPALPPIDSPYVAFGSGEIDTLSLLRRYSADPDAEANTPFAWIVTADYSTVSASGSAANGPSDDPGSPGGDAGSGGSGASSNPELQRPVVEWDFEEVQWFPTRDINGKPYLNSALDPFEPHPVRAGYRVYVCVRNELTWNAARARRFDFAVNGDVFQGYPPGQCLCLPARGKEEWRGALSYWTCTYRVLCRPPFMGSWQFKPIDRGFSERVAGQRVRISVNGEYPPEPLPLDGSGRLLGIDPANPQLVFRPEQQDYDVQLFADLNLPAI